MNLTYIAGFAWEPKGTVRARAFPMAQEMVRRGHKVVIIVVPYDNPRHSGQQWMREGVHIINLEVPDGWSLAYTALPHKIVKAAEQTRPDVVHIFKPKGFAGMAASKLLRSNRRSLVLDCDDWEGWGGWNDVTDYPWAVKEFIDRQEQSLIRKCPVLTCASRVLVERALHSGRSDDEIFYMPNGASTQQIRDAHQVLKTPASVYKRKLQLGLDPVVLYAGHFQPADDVEFFCRAFERACRFFRLPITLALAGNGPTLSNAKRILDSVPNLQLFCFGEVAYADYAQLVAAADVAAFPYPENPIYRAKCSVRIIDYMLFGKAVISSAVGQNTEYILHGQSGLLIPPGDEEAFAGALLTLLEDSSLRSRLGQNARERLLQNFVWTGKLGDTCESAYRKAANPCQTLHSTALPITA